MFPLNTKFFRASLLQNTSGRLFLLLSFISLRNSINYFKRTSSNYCRNQKHSDTANTIQQSENLALIMDIVHALMFPRKFFNFPSKNFFWENWWNFFCKCCNRNHFTNYFLLSFSFSLGNVIKRYIPNAGCITQAILPSFHW